MITVPWNELLHNFCVTALSTKPTRLETQEFISCHNNLALVPHTKKKRKTYFYCLLFSNISLAFKKIYETSNLNFIIELIYTHTHTQIAKTRTDVLFLIS